MADPRGILASLMEEEKAGVLARSRDDSRAGVLSRFQLDGGLRDYIMNAAPNGYVIPPSKGEYRGQIIPLKKDLDTGEVSFAVPGIVTGAVDSAVSGFTAPYRAMSGQLRMTDDAGRTSPEAIAAAMDTAGLLTLGSGAMPASDDELRMGMHFRRNNREVPYNDVPWMQFAADDPDAVANYGKNLWAFDDETGKVIDAGGVEFRKALYRSLRSDPDSFKNATGLEATKENIKAIVDEADPSSIVDSAGVWDNPDIVQKIWDEILEKRGVSAVRTKDGAIVFDPQFVKALRDGDAL